MPSAGARRSGAMLRQLLAKPWIDPVCIWGMGKLLPASRLWAAAAKARGDAKEFARLAGLSGVSRRTASRIGRTEALRGPYFEAHEAWVRAVFTEGGEVSRREIARRKAAQAFLGQRFAYLLLAGIHNIAAADFDIPTPKSTRQELRGALDDPDRFFSTTPDSPAIERGHSVDHGDIAEYWLRFAGSTDGASDTVFVHVYEPKGAARPPSFIFCHGLAMELEMLAEAPGDFPAIARQGIRVLLPDAPGHNRRCPDGCYGGESFIRRAPVSSIHHFREAAQDCAAIVEWCRSQGSMRVALGGISLGALSAQVAASRWSRWPQSSRADYLFLATTTDAVSDLTRHSSLAMVCKLDRLLAEAGWSEAETASLAPITDAAPRPPVEPENIVLVLGARDDLTPIAGGRRLAANWRVPPANLFLRDQGHFSAAFGLNADPAPFRRLIDLLKG